MALHAVLTGDIVNSTRLTTDNEKKIVKQLRSILLPVKHEFFRGDSFQAYIKDAATALQTAILCRLAAIAVPPGETGTNSDMRISIGIGTVISPVTKLSTAKGDAFVLSGRAFDQLMKDRERLVIVTYDSIANTAFSVISDYLNSILNNLTDRQAAVIIEMLSGVAQKNVAKKLGKSKSTISQHVSSGRFYELERLLQQYENIVKQMK
jgi:hypothetical protein